MHRPALAVATAVFLSAASSSGCHMGLAALAMGADQSSGPYQAGAIAADLGPDSVRTLACLDVGLAMDDERGPLLVTHVGNHCVHAEPFALDRIVLHAKDREGKGRDVTLHDPRREIQRLHVGALERGRERVRLDGLDGVEQICFELAGVAPDAPQARTSPICFSRALDGWRTEPAT
jgi:hypothetical protein